LAFWADFFYEGTTKGIQAKHADRLRRRLDRLDTAGAVCGRYQRLLQKGKPKGKVIACIARELAGFIWALGTMEPMEHLMPNRQEKAA
jgi:hypothetical protein